MNKITKSIYKLDEQQIKNAMKSVDESTFPEMDEALKYIGKEVIASYALWYITESQRKKLTEYKEYRKPKNTEWLERYLFDSLKVLESYDETPELFQVWVMEWRIVVASVQSVSDGKKYKNKANWWESNIIEIYKSEAPKAYEYAKKNYGVYVAIQ